MTAARRTERCIVQTKKAFDAIKSINPAILVEGEIGWIAASSEILEKASEGVGVLTTPEEAKQFVDATNIDVLAPAVGNMHGLLQSMVHGEAETRLDVQGIAEIKTVADIFMTLHGGSGTRDVDFHQAIKLSENSHCVSAAALVGSDRWESSLSIRRIVR
jgi:fructose-bisphosphate aldolase class II